MAVVPAISQGYDAWQNAYFRVVGHMDTFDLGLSWLKPCFGWS